MSTTLDRLVSAPGGVTPATSTVADVIELARETGVQIVDLRFVDLPGQAQHFSIPVRELTDNLFIDGIGFDGSSIRGFQHIHESDMLLMPDPATAYLDPTLRVPTLIVVCMLPAIIAGSVGAMAVGGVHALAFGLLWGVVLGLLAVLFGLFLGWLSHRV